MQPNPFDPLRSFAQQSQPQTNPQDQSAPQGQPWPAPGTVPGVPLAPPPGPAPAGPPPRGSWFARHKVLTVIGGLVLVGVVGGVAGGGGSDDDPGPAEPTAPATSAPEVETPMAEPPSDTPVPAAPTVEETETAESLPGVGTPARDGTFEFTVTGVETGVATIGSDTFGTTAQGQFALVSVTVANIGDAAQSFFGDNATLVDTQGREHSADSSAAIYLESSESFFTEINPGNTVDAVVVFDIPADAVPAALELHDSLFSGGVTVTLQ